MGILGTYLDGSSTQFDKLKEDILGSISVVTGAATSIYMPIFSTGDFAPNNHYHTGYAERFSTGDYAAASHLHDYSNLFAPIGAASSNHVHSGYAPLFSTGDYAITLHGHTSTGTYSTEGHTHAGGTGGTQYTLQVMAANIATVVDATTYYVGSLAGLAPQTAGGVTRLYIPKTGSIKKAYIMWRSATAGTNENITCNIRKNNTSDTLVQTVGVAASIRTFINNTLNIAVTEGDYIEIKFVCPSWATNPATLAISGIIYIE